MFIWYISNEILINYHLIMKQFVIQKQLIPFDINIGDGGWVKRQIWVLKLNSADTIDDFDTVDEAILKKNQLIQNDPTARVYKIVEVVDGKYIDVII
jgi:hypothetical protein